MRSSFVVMACLLAAGCGTPAPTGDAGPDARRDATGTTDAPPGTDVPVGSDVPVGIDVPPGSDVPAPRDVPVAMDTSRPDTAVPCTGGCPANAHCVASRCECDPYFVDMGGACAPTTPSDPATRMDSEVCAQWAEGHRTTTTEAFTRGTGGECDPGSMSRLALNDSLRRVNMFRWLVGLRPVTDDATRNQADQECSLMEDLRGFPGAGNPDPHNPTADWRCYTMAGDTAAGQSNISWGTRSAPDAIDNFMVDNGNETTMGHRRWILNPPLGPIGIGFYGTASCLGVFARTGGGTAGEWYSYPPPGPVPVSLVNGYWTFHSSRLDLTRATVAVVRTSDSMTMPIRRLMLGRGYADNAIGWANMGWRGAAGESFRVTISGLSGGASDTVTYTVRAVSCM